MPGEYHVKVQLRSYSRTGRKQLIRGPWKEEKNFEEKCENSVKSWFTSPHEVPLIDEEVPGEEGIPDHQQINHLARLDDREGQT